MQIMQKLTEYYLMTNSVKFMQQTTSILSQNMSGVEIAAEAGQKSSEREQTGERAESAAHNPLKFNNNYLRSIVMSIVCLCVCLSARISL